MMATFSIPLSMLCADLRLPEGTQIIEAQVIGEDLTLEVRHPQIDLDPTEVASVRCEVRATQSVWVKQ